MFVVAVVFFPLFVLMSAAGNRHLRARTPGVVLLSQLHECGHGGESGPFVAGVSPRLLVEAVAIISVSSQRFL